jgi:hypothetical protein
VEPDEHKQFVAVMTVLAEFYDKPFSEGAIALWWSLLKKYPLKRIVEAVEAHCADPEHGRYPPKPADLVGRLDGLAGDLALEAWSKTLKAIRRIGAWDSVLFDDPKIHAVIDDMGGWVKLCSTEDKQLPFVAKEFCERYKGSKAETWPKILQGIAEIENRASGMPVMPPTVIGDKSKALLTYEQGGAQRIKIEQLESSPDVSKVLRNITLAGKMLGSQQ